MIIYMVFLLLMSLQTAVCFTTTFKGRQRHNGLVPDSAAIDVAAVENTFNGESTVSPLWQWEVSGISVL